MNKPGAKPPTILIIDDNEDDYEAVVRAFKKMGLGNPLSHCTTGLTAMEFLQSSGGGETAQAGIPALILLDLNMPGMDGHKVLQLIKADERLKRIPVIIWTTSSNDKDINACYLSGANAYMQKPPTFEALLVSVKRLKEYWLETALLPNDALDRLNN